jgi:hypothetical protein
MPALSDVIAGLGLDESAVRDVGSFAASRADRAIAFTGPQDELQHPDGEDSGYETGDRTGAERDIPLADRGISPEDEAARAGRVRYVSDHGFRAVELIALFDQHAAIHLGERLMSFLRIAEDACWPLAYASAYLPLPIPGRTDPDPDWHDIADRLAAEPATAAREMARCLLPQALQQPFQPGSTVFPLPVWNEERPAPRWSRRALTPYGIDLELLRTVARGRDGGTQPLIVCEISMPALARTLFRSIEAALADARQDAYHWGRGLSTIQPTDPEVLLAVRVCLRSEAAGGATRDLPLELPMSRALVRLVQAIDPSTSG